MTSLVADGMHYIRMADGSEELYILDSDPEERFDLAGSPAQGVSPAIPNSTLDDAQEAGPLAAPHPAGLVVYGLTNSNTHSPHNLCHRVPRLGVLEVPRGARG